MKIQVLAGNLFGRSTMKDAALSETSTMTFDDLNDIQRYLVEEEAEKWQDGLVSRREFLRRVTLMVGSASAAAGVLLSLGCDLNAPEAVPTATQGSSPPTDQPGTSPYHVGENDPAVRAETVDIPQTDPAVKLKGYLATPQGKTQSDKAEGVLVIHENRGLTDYVKDVVRRIAAAGYTGLAVDLLSRQGGSDAHPDEGERTGLLAQTPVDTHLADLEAGLDFLKSRSDVDPDKLGVVGFCFGGGLTWRLATRRADLKAAVPFYGPNPPLEDVPNIKAAVLGIYGGKDTQITGQVPALEDALKKAGVKYEIKV
jgi:carboxymethylenebutenolidase